MREWKRVKLGEVSKMNLETLSPKKKLDYINYLDTGNITSNKIDIIQKLYINNDKVPSRAKRMISANDIIYSNVRPNQKHFGIIKDPLENMIVSTGFTTITVDKNIANSLYVYYYISQNEIITGLQVIAEQSVSTYPSIKPSDLENLEINLPPLPEQHRIASILSSLDDKIELNNRINKNLEEQASALFRRWFVDFEFPDPENEGKPYRSSGGKFIDSELGEIPEGWRVGKLEELINIRYGKDHKKLNEGNIPVYGSGGIMRYVDKAIYSEETVLIPRKGTLNNIFLINQPFWSVDTMFYSEMRKKGIAKYIYFFLKNKDLSSMNAGSAVPSMTTEILNRMLILISADDIFIRYNQIASSIFDTIYSNQKINNDLIILRNTLLPKLMNNEIKV